MRPCNCKDMYEAKKLNHQGISFNEYSITVKPMGVIIEVYPHYRIRLPMTIFKRFAKWYLEDQE